MVSFESKFNGFVNIAPCLYAFKVMIRLVTPS